jgi:uncharacterized membrane protein SpoIIM required for sporulation
MKETRFIAQNKEKWQESEKLLTESDKDPEKLSNLFTQVIDDLSYSRTYYPNRSVRVYLNKIAREYFSIIYRHHTSRKNTFKNFWIDELPQIVYQSRRPLLISLGIFVLAACIGIFSSAKDSGFTASILGDRYVAMTKANIEKGDPMAVYKEAHQVDMFLGITLNNLMVAFRTYVFGLFLSIGTVAILLYNGIMVGCFQFFFVEHELLAESALTIWLHGTLEISSIIIAGGAGLTLGSGLLFPGTYSRLQAFQITGMRSLKLMLGVAPILVLAGLIESFLTRYTDVPDILRFLLILASAVFILGYFVYYPWKRSRVGFDQPLEEAKLPPSINEPVSFTRIKNNGEIIRDSFTFYKKFSSPLFKWALMVTALMTVAELLSSEPRELLAPPTELLLYLLNEIYYGIKTTSPLFIAINTFGSSLIIYRVFMLLDSEAKQSPLGLLRFQTMIQMVVVVGLGYASLYYLDQWGVILLLVACSLLLMIAFIQFTERRDLFNSVVRTIRLSSEVLSQVMGLHFVLIMLSFSFLLIVSAPLLYVSTSILEWNFAETDVWSKNIFNFIDIFLKLLALNLVIPIFASSVAYLYFSLREIHSADHLKQAINMIGNRTLKSARS